MALTVQLGVEEQLAEEVMMVAVMATMVKLMVMDNIYMSIHVVHVGCQVMESTVDACKVVEACLTCTDLRFDNLLLSVSQDLSQHLSNYGFNSQSSMLG